MFVYSLWWRKIKFNEKKNKARYKITIPILSFVVPIISIGTPTPNININIILNITFNLFIFFYHSIKHSNC